MDRNSALIETFISNWNCDFPNYPLTAGDLQKPHAVMGALFQIFDRLGIDKEVVLTPPPEECWTENTAYYADLLPVINMTRVINHLVPIMPQVDASISISHFLQPTAPTSHSILLVLYNLMVFNEARLIDIAPYEEELFAKTEQVQSLEERKNKLLELLNEQSEEKGKRSLRLEKLESEIRQYEEDLKLEKEEHDKEKLELEAIVKENKQMEMVLEQKKSHRDELMDEVVKKRALRVYDAEDVRHKAEQAAQNDQEAEEKLQSLRATLMLKENSLKNLHTIKRNLDTANTLLQEIMKVSDNLRDFETGDLESESKEGEIDVLITEASELEAQLTELQTARAEAAKVRLDNQLKRQQDKTILHSALREAEEKDKKMREQDKKVLQRTEEIKEATLRYEAEKKKGMEELAQIKEQFCTELKAIDEITLNKVDEAAKKVEEKLDKLRNLRRQ